MERASVVFYALQDLCVLFFEPGVGKRHAGVLCGGIVQFGEDADDFDTARLAPGAQHQMRLLGGRRAGQAELDEPFVRDMSIVHATSRVGVASSLRSRRMARNRCTRTVASLTPSAALTSLVLCSATWQSVNTAR